MFRIGLFCWGMLTGLGAVAQVYDWAAIVGWDGVSHWSRYLIYAPGYLGPNALPVPALPDGRTDTVSWIGTGLAGHTKPGDQTANLLTQFMYTPAPGRVAFELYLVPHEVFRMTREEFARRHAHVSGLDDRAATGDLHINSYLQLLRGRRVLPDLQLRVSLRTASSNSRAAARYTDAPGYYMDLNWGRDLSAAAARHRWRLYGTLGFYVWQLNTGEQPQNDAVLYGLGFSYTHPRLQIGQDCTGYAGYLDNGDRPLVLRTRISMPAGPVWLEGQFHQGLMDAPYTSAQLMVKMILGKNK
ncbi:MAG: hypothetical protein SF053_09125 [Bacteroidia bacterium]|nr:hypothetical protein [Bacteroidia bacterium]